MCSFIIPLCNYEPTFWLRFHLRLISFYPLIKNQTLLLSGFDLFILSLTHTLSLSLTITNTHIHKYTHTLSLSLSLSLSHTHTRIYYILTHSITHICIHIRTPSLTHADSLSLSCSCFFNPSQLLHPNPHFPHVFSPARDILCQRIIMIPEKQILTRDGHVTLG